MNVSINMSSNKSISPFVNYTQDQKETVMVSDGFNPDDLDLDKMSGNKRPALRMYNEENDDEENANLDQLYYSVDGDNFSLNGTLFSCSSKNKVIEIGFKPSQFDEPKLVQLLKDFIFSKAKICTIHNIKVANVFLFENEDGLEPETSNFKWTLNDIIYCDGLLTLQLTN